MSPNEPREFSGIAPETQRCPELYGWDYSEEKMNENGQASYTGVGFLILYPDGDTDLIHFNDSWNLDSMLQAPHRESSFPGYSRDRLLEGKSDFKFICELP